MSGVWLPWAVLFMLLTISAGIDLTHIEKNADSSPSCPACTFHMAGIADAAMVYLLLPAPVLNGMVVFFEVSKGEFSTGPAWLSVPLRSLQSEFRKLLDPRVSFH